MHSSNQAPQAALRCLRHLCRKPITNAVLANASAVAELDTTACKLWAQVVNRYNQHGVAAALEMLPSELIAAFMAAAARLNTYLTQQQQQQQQQPQLARLVCALLRVWGAVAIPSSRGCPDAWVLRLLPALPNAAELALHVLTGPEGCGLACGLSTQQHSSAVFDAAVAMKLIETCATQWNNMVLIESQQAGGTIRPATRAEAPVLSDAVQKALILHCCVLLRAWKDREQHAAAAASTTAPHSSSSSSTWAPSEAKKLLQQLGFPLAAVQLYAVAVCDTFNTATITIMRHTDWAHLAVQSALANRLVALRQRDWPVRYRGIIPAAATAAAAAGSAGPQVDGLLVHVFAIGVVPEQLIYLTLEFLAVLGFGPDRTESAVSAVALVQQLLIQAITLRQQPQYALERSVQEGYARGCLEYVWSGLGRQLLKAAGVTDAELEGGSPEAAAADRPNAYSATLMREGTAVEMPADAQARLGMVWREFSNCLFYAIRYYEDCFEQPSSELYMRHPLRTSRVLEAAMRTAPLTTFPAEANMLMLIQLILGAYHAAAEATSAEGATPGAELMQNKRLATRYCSQQVSYMKALSMPLPPGIQQHDVGVYLIALAVSATVVGPTVHSWAIGEPRIKPLKQAAIWESQPRRLQQSNSLPLGRDSITLSDQEVLDAPCYPAWLAITGRALLTAGRLLQEAAPWLQVCMRQAIAGHPLPALIQQMSSLSFAMGWLCQQLSQLKQHPDAAAAAKLPLGLLNELSQLAEGLAPNFRDLNRLCNSTAETATYRRVLQGSADGWLHEGLQQLGGKVWVAWPQGFACNDDRCLEMGGLAEQSCIGGRQRCGDCMVAYYCCKEHQTRHWRQHKMVCGHLKQLRREAAQGAAAAAAAAPPGS